jgi:hypothetical protein
MYLFANSEAMNRPGLTAVMMTAGMGFFPGCAPIRHMGNAVRVPPAMVYRAFNPQTPNSCKVRLEDFLRDYVRTTPSGEEATIAYNLLQYSLPLSGTPSIRAISEKFDMITGSIIEGLSHLRELRSVECHGARCQTVAEEMLIHRNDVLYGAIAYLRAYGVEDPQLLPSPSASSRR